MGLSDQAQSLGLSITSLVLTVLISWTQVAVCVRRLHDLDKTGWLLPLFIVPIAGLIILVWLFGRQGTAGQNRFGFATGGAAN